MKNISSIIGKEYLSPKNREEYGLFRKVSGKLPAGFSAAKCGKPFAEDGCGNLFTMDKKQRICFWDHETERATVIASSWAEFVSGCAKPKVNQLDDDEPAISIWVDPVFAEKHGIKAPKDGWIKRET